MNPKLAKQLERRRESVRRGRHRLGPGRGARVRVAPRGRASRSGSRGRTPSAGRSRTGTRCCTTRGRERRTRRSRRCRRRRPRSRSTTRRSPSTPRSRSSTATRSPLPMPSCSGRRSSATSSTALRSSSTSSSSRAARSGVRPHGSSLLLPHGYEGNGPEHSSARLERFLQLAAQDNIRIVNCTTAAQFFHLLRRQALDATARPLVVMTPKGLLRLRRRRRRSTSSRWARSSPCSTTPDGRPQHVRRLVLCSGKIYYDIAGHELRGARDDRRPSRGSSSCIRSRSIPSALVASYPELREIVWAQEEPQNMGAWRSIRHRLEEAAGARAACRARPVRRPAVAREPERGLPDAPPARAGPDRPRGARAVAAGSSLDARATAPA